MTIHCTHCRMPVSLRITEYEKCNDIRMRVRKPYKKPWRYDTGIIKAKEAIPPLQCPCCGTRITKLKQYLKENEKNGEVEEFD